MVRAPIPQNIVPFLDHAGRSCSSLWDGEIFLRPQFSFQIYSTLDLGPDGPLHRHPQGLFKDDVGAWRFDVYPPLPDVEACIEHQKREIPFRRAEGGRAGEIVENYGGYGEKTVMKGLIIVIDSADWNERGGKGPLFVRFDLRPVEERIVEEGLIDAEWGVLEQIELEIKREVPTPSYAMTMVWAKCGSGEFERDDLRESQQQQQPGDNELALPTSTSVPPPPSNILEPFQPTNDFNYDITIIEDHPHPPAIILTYPPPPSTTNPPEPDLIYNLYSTSHPLSPSQLTTLGLTFLTSILSHLSPTPPTIRLKIHSPLPSVLACISHSRRTGYSSVGYLSPFPTSPLKRRFPEHGVRCDMEHMRTANPTYSAFLIVLDRVDFVAGDGVLLVWADEEGEGGEAGGKVLVGRVRGMERVAKRLAGME